MVQSIFRYLQSFAHLLTSVTDRQTDGFSYSKCHACLRCMARKTKMKLFEINIDSEDDI